MSLTRGTGRAIRTKHVYVPVVGLALMACGCSTTAIHTTQVTHELAGTVSIKDAHPGKLGTPCTGRGRDADIAKGALVVVTDHASKELARTTLEPGTVAGFSECRFRFVITIPDLDSYAVQVSNRKPIPRMHEAMEDDNWTVDLTPGWSG